jgi:hypothetical protein
MTDDKDSLHLDVMPAFTFEEKLSGEREVI